MKNTLAFPRHSHRQYLIACSTPSDQILTSGGNGLHGNEDKIQYVSYALVVSTCEGLSTKETSSDQKESNNISRFPYMYLEDSQLMGRTSHSVDKNIRLPAHANSYPAQHKVGYGLEPIQIRLILERRGKKT